MQYLLTEEEYANLKTKKRQLEDIDKDKLQKLCTEIADAMPVKRHWSNETSPWGCILSEEHGHHYCDHCPVQKICPYHSKRWSK